MRLFESSWEMQNLVKKEKSKWKYLVNQVKRITKNDENEIINTVQEPVMIYI